MSDRQAINEIDVIARKNLVLLAQEMLNGDFYFFQGATQVLALKDKIGGVVDRDPDFDAFVVIASETDHLPFETQISLWSSEAIKQIRPEFFRTEEWASSFAPAACKNLIARFS